MIYAIGIVVTVAWVIYALLRPLGGDSGIFMWAGEVIARGGVMYRDAWDVKGPLVYYVSALVYTLTGPSAWGFRLLDILVHALGTIGVWALAQRLTRERTAGLAAAIIYVLWYAGLDYWNTGQPDGWAGVLLLWGAWGLLANETPGFLRVGLSGVALGLTLLVKPTYGLAVMLAAFPLLLGRRAGVRACALRCATFALGMVLPVLVTVLYFVQVGAFGALVEVYLQYTAEVYAGLSAPWATRFQDFVTAGLGKRLALAMPFAATGAVSLWRSDRRAALALLAWAGSMACDIIIQGKVTWAYHWLPTFAPLAVLTGIGVAMVWRAIVPHTPAAWLAYSVAALAYGGAAFTPAQDLYRWTKYLLGRTSFNDYEAQEYGYWGRQTQSIYGLAHYLASHTRQNDRVAIVAMEPWANVLSQRQSPTRFAVTRPLFDGDGTRFQTLYRAELFRDLNSHPPAYVVTLTQDSCAKYEKCLERFPALQAWITAHYTPETVISSREIWKRTAE